MTLNPAELQARVAAIPWYHSIALGNGIVTPGVVALDAIPKELLPDCSGRSVLDIGAWDGANAFRAEQAGAARVVALDHYAWGVDFQRRAPYWEECTRKGVIPDPQKDETEFWDPTLGQKRGFDLAHEVLGSSVQAVVADFMKMDLTDLGTFDVVFYLNVLYHMREPLSALQRVRQVTREVAVIETDAIAVRGYPDASLLEFYPANELMEDYGNWYVPTEKALHGLCQAAGFGKVVTRRADAKPGRRSQPVRHYRLLVHAYP
jgi:tRNA (mo5U34)-methyltransferase